MYYSQITIAKVNAGAIVLTEIHLAVIGVLFTKISFPTRKAHTLVVLRECENYATIKYSLLVLVILTSYEFMSFSIFIECQSLPNSLYHSLKTT